MVSKSESVGQRGGETPAAPRPLTFIEQARRAQIIAAATEVVAEVGYARASLARIAQHAGISKGVVTYHFRSKDEILSHLVNDYFERGWAFMEERILVEPTALGQVHAWVGAQLDFYARNRREFLAMLEVVASHRGADGGHQFAEDFEEEVVGLTEILASGQAAGDLRDFEPRSVARIILRCLDGVLGSWATNPGLDLAAERTALLDFISHAIRNEQ